MKILLILLFIINLLGCSSSGNNNEVTKIEKEIPNYTEIWGDYETLDNFKEHKFQTGFIYLDKKENMITVSLLPKSTSIEVLILNTGLFSSVIPPLTFLIKEPERMEFIECLDKFLNWDSIARKNKDSFYKNICSVNLYIVDSNDNTYFNQNVSINFFNDNPNTNLLEFKYRREQRDQEIRISRREVELIKNYISNKNISEKSKEYIRKENEINNRYK
ncbi:hypothetical protein LPTSP2_38970 [Leptospira ellinghausenii]|uniref:Lipoprotein n=1 Tax=Leptospira ellinghausenii TaxID=1917822 RepID=A0A2P2DJ04_9LEPT|nr:hypothetical protein [Leptospira ellinghausenii]GBF44594.1 hypothetical protein LPTSP2_38970 [Leptospira ellinghausenii]